MGEGRARPGPSVSIVVPVLNGAATIGDLLSALAQQRGAPAGCELIVVDNGSTDRTPEIARGFGATVLGEPTRGPAAARNRGLRHARGDIVVHLDADTLPTRRWLQEMVGPFVDANVLLVGGKTLSFRPESPVERFVERFGLYDTEFHVTRGILPFVASLNMAVRRGPALAVGGWAENMLTSEDVDFCHRLLQQFPGRIAYQPRAVLLHRHRSTIESLRRQAWTYGEGVAQMYGRYPDLLEWDRWRMLRAARTMAWRAVKPAVLRVAVPLGIAARDDLEYAQCHRLWSWWFWRGFASYRRHRAYRPHR